MLNEEPVVLNNVLTDNEYTEVYLSAREIADRGMVNKYNGCVHMNVQLSQELITKIENIFRDTFSIKGNIKFLINFLRYSNKSGHKPNLKPHWDRGLDYPAYMMTVQLDKTLDWPIGAKDTVVSLPKNSGILFSGSEYAHYRPQVNFTDEDEYDVLLVQAELTDLPKIDVAENDARLNDDIYRYAKKLGFIE